MTDELKQILYNVAAWAGGVISAFIVQHYRPKQVQQDEHDKSQNNTIQIQGQTLEGAWKMILQLQQQIFEQNQKINELDQAVTKYARGLYRANKFINEHVRGVPIPDFLLDTDPNIGKK